MTNIINTTFRLPSVHRLQISLGKIDATVECTELAIRELISAGLGSGSINLHLKNLSARHGIRADHIDPNLLKVRTSQLYIIAVYEQAEGFLESFRDEHPQSSLWKYTEGDDLFKRILKNIPHEYDDAKKAVGSLEVDLFDYYRLIRNRFVHPEIKEEKSDNKTLQLRESVSHHPKYSKLQAPNIFSEISFDDFVLFTRILKRIAWSLCAVSRPTDQEISDATAKLIKAADQERKEGAAKPKKAENFILDLQKLKRLKENRLRVEHALESFLHQMYRLKGEEAKPIVQLLYRDLLA